MYYADYQKKLNKTKITFTIQEGFKNSALSVMTDLVKLKQIFFNLINNAFKFTDEGNIEVGFKGIEQDQLVFFVSDTGIGIPAEKFKDIFKRFLQLNLDETRVYGGTGIGLSIVNELLILMGGRIYLESEVGKGTVFYFSVPYIPVNLGKIDHTIKNKILPNHGDKIVVLIVDDDMYNRAYLKEILSESRYTLLYTEFGKEAVEMALTKDIDLVLMDICLPDISGFEAIQLILEQKPDLAIIAQTAYASSADYQKAMDAGCVNYISKPINKLELLKKMEEVFT